MTTAKGGRPATGSVKYGKDKHGRPCWLGRVELPDGRRPWVALDPGIPEADEARARACAVETRAWFKEHPTLDRHVALAVAEYAKTWNAWREKHVPSWEDSKSHLDTHILPILGALDVRAVARPDVEGLVAHLDKLVAAGKMSPKTAKNVWGTCSKFFDDAANAKPATGLRCLDADPTAGIRGPDEGGPSKRLQFLYPAEVSKFLACEKVPRRWRQNVAIAVYLCLRDGEQRALKWSAVDLEHGVVTVQEVFDRNTLEEREGTKTGAARLVPIPPTLLPLLALMHKRAGGKGHVSSMSSLRDMARGLRRWLWRAGVRRQELHTGTSVSKALRWHDTRGTGATWLAVQGRPATEIRDILGHTQTAMTDRYVRAAAILRTGRFGEPFPALPEDLVDGLDPVAPRAEPTFANHSIYNDSRRGGRDSNPRPPA